MWTKIATAAVMNGLEPHLDEQNCFFFYDLNFKIPNVSFIEMLKFNFRVAPAIERIRYNRNERIHCRKFHRDICTQRHLHALKWNEWHFLPLTNSRSTLTQTTYCCRTSSERIINFIDQSVIFSFNTKSTRLYLLADSVRPSDRQK